MLRYVMVSIAGGILFGFMDGLIHANAWAQELYAVYKPIAKESINVWLGISADLFYGLITAGIFLQLYSSLPGSNGILKGISYAVLMGFFRVGMSVIGEWVTTVVPTKTLMYTLITGCLEMLLLGVVYGWSLKPAECN
jgi:hypothetical protein